MVPLSLEDRVQHLEQTVTDLEKKVEKLWQGVPTGEDGRIQAGNERLPSFMKSDAVPQEPQDLRHLETAVHAPVPFPSRPSLPEPLRQSEFWLRMVGIGLLLFAVAFLFSYAIEQGWLSPAVRVAMGLLTGATLLALGLRMGDNRPEFSQVLLGGGIGAFYITGTAAYQLYNLVPHIAAFLFMVLNTALAFILSLYRDEAILSLIGLLGGLGTPFLLGGDNNGPTELVSYLSILIVGVGVVYFSRGWQLLLWLGTGGSLLIYSVTIVGFTFSIAAPLIGTAIIVQLGLVTALLVFWALPVWRAVLAARHPDHWRPTRLGIADQYLPNRLQRLLQHDFLVLTMAAPFMTLLFSFLLWASMDQALPWGWITLVVAGLFLALGALLWNEPVGRSRGVVHDLVGLSLLTLSLPLLFDDWMLLLAYAGEIIALHLIARRLTRTVFAAAAYIVTGIAISLALAHLAIARSEDADLATHLSLLTVMITFMTLSIWLRKLWAQDAYILAAFALIALWLPIVLMGATLTVAYSALVAILHFMGWVLRRHRLVWGGHLAVALVAMSVWARLAGSSPPVSALADLLFTTTVAMISFLLAQIPRRLYLLFAHLSLLFWFWSTLGALNNGQALISVAWGIYGVTLLLVGLRLGQPGVRLIALGTLAILVVKLFIIDLANVATTLRIILFFGFGVLFLVLGYFYPSLWRSQIDLEPRMTKQ